MSPPSRTTLAVDSDLGCKRRLRDAGLVFVFLGFFNLESEISLVMFCRMLLPPRLNSAGFFCGHCVAPKVWTRIVEIDPFKRPRLPTSQMPVAERYEAQCFDVLMF